MNVVYICVNQSTVLNGRLSNVEISVGSVLSFFAVLTIVSFKNKIIVLKNQL